MTPYMVLKFTEDTLCMWCGKEKRLHGEPGQSEMGGPRDQMCPVDGVTSQFFTPKLPSMSDILPVIGDSVMGLNRSELLSGLKDLDEKLPSPVVDFDPLKPEGVVAWAEERIVDHLRSGALVVLSRRRLRQVIGFLEAP